MPFKGGENGDLERPRDKGSPSRGPALRIIPSIRLSLGEGSSRSPQRQANPLAVAPWPSSPRAPCPGESQREGAEPQAPQPEEPKSARSAATRWRCGSGHSGAPPGRPLPSHLGPAAYLRILNIAQLGLKNEPFASRERRTSVAWGPTGPCTGHRAPWGPCELGEGLGCTPKLTEQGWQL